jgi:hypothetical protein
MSRVYFTATQAHLKLFHWLFAGLTNRNQTTFDLRHSLGRQNLLGPWQVFGAGALSGGTLLGLRHNHCSFVSLPQNFGGDVMFEKDTIENCPDSLGAI